jgi:hypothetical protein
LVVMPPHRCWTHGGTGCYLERVSGLAQLGLPWLIS